MEAMNRPPADSDTVGARQASEALPLKILGDPSTGDALNNQATCLSALNHLPAIGVRALPRRGAAHHRTQPQRSPLNSFRLRRRNRSPLPGGHLEKSIPI
jgi:hypothetical protein